MFADVTSLNSALLDKKSKDFVSHHILEAVPFVFSSDLAAWIGWKTMLAEHLEVDPRDVVLIGSGAIGFSLNPYKKFKPFDHRSDLDCGIVSSYHFENAWRYLRQIRTSWLSLPGNSKRAIEMHRKNLVFSGMIATDVILSLLPFGIAWQSALDRMGTVVPTQGREVKLRIYKDFDALRSYQVRNIDQLRDELASAEKPQDQPVKLEG